MQRRSIPDELAEGAAVQAAVDAAVKLGVQPRRKFGESETGTARELGISGQRVSAVKLGQARNPSERPRNSPTGLGGSETGTGEGKTTQGFLGGNAGKTSLVPFEEVLSGVGVSVVGIDPGGTTGVAVWDAWDQQWYVDQIDAGMGVRHRQKAIDYSRHTEAWNRAAKALSYGPYSKKLNRDAWQVLVEVETGVVRWLIDIVRACGPNTVVVMEDFVLYITDHMSSKREGLSPVRIMSMFEMEARTAGLLSGDAWRWWTGFGVSAMDNRGVWVGPQGIGTFHQRLDASVTWAEHTDVGALVNAKNMSVDDQTAAGVVRMGGALPGKQQRAFGGGVQRDRLAAGRGRPVVPVNHESGVGVRWNGPGITYTRSMPSRKNECTDDFMKSAGLWVRALPHGMDAKRHAVVALRAMAVPLQKGGESIFTGRWQRAKK